MAAIGIYPLTFPLSPPPRLHARTQSHTEAAIHYLALFSPDDCVTVENSHFAQDKTSKILGWDLLAKGVQSCIFSGAYVNAEIVWVREREREREIIYRSTHTHKTLSVIAIFNTILYGTCFCGSVCMIIFRISYRRSSD